MADPLFGDRRIGKEVLRFDAHVSLELFNSGIDPGQDGSHSDELERAAHRKTFIQTVTDDSGRFHIENRNAKSAAAGCFDPGKRRRQRCEAIAICRDGRSRRQTGSQHSRQTAFGEVASCVHRCSCRSRRVCENLSILSGIATAFGAMSIFEGAQYLRRRRRGSAGAWVV